MSKTSRFCRDGPEQVTHTIRKTTDRGGGHFATRAALRTVKQIQIRLLLGPLRCEHEDGFTWHALSEQVAHPFDARAGLARPCWARYEEFRIEGRFNDLTLKQVEACPEWKRRIRHEARVQDGTPFVNTITIFF